MEYGRTFLQPVTPIDNADRHLQPPALTKQFLISPPASPPVGWEPRDEGEPLVNYDLLAAIANLTPGTSSMLFPLDRVVSGEINLRPPRAKTASSGSSSSVVVKVALL